MSQNSGGYNGYFFENNLNALKKAKMPQYSSEEQTQEDLLAGGGSVATTQQPTILPTTKLPSWFR